MGIITTGPAVKKHISLKRARELIAMYQLCAFVVPDLSTSSSTTPTFTSSSSSSQDSVFDVNRYTENPVPERSGSTNEELRGNPLHKPKETESKNQNDGGEEVQSDLLRDLLDWLQDFRDIWSMKVVPCA